MYDLDRIKKEFKEFCEKGGCPVKDNFVISLNNRLTRTLGKVKSRRDFEGGYSPFAVDFSTNFIHTATDESIRSVIEHEGCHYIATVRSHSIHKHDDYFKSICAEMGCDNNKAQTKVERIVGTEKIYKYSVFCKNCGFLCGYNRANRIITNLSTCSCKKCKSKELYYTQNW